ncbi:MAG TPA: ABC transporter transmembrane domain-containing protein, partial [Phenylobacterium sp.]|nr:ABC transporter transmembrane domain-containing protein [Phenylobacterium sp.]
MTDQASVSPPVSDPGGRPGRGAELAQSLDEAAERRPRSRNIGALRRLAPFASRRPGEVAGALVFLVTAAAATLGLSGAVRLLVDALTAPDVTGAQVNLWFGLIGAVALVLALSSALRYFFVTRLGERVVADLRQAVFGHILTLDPGF